MSEESVRPVNPLPEEFAGENPARSAKRLFHAMRPKFFPASVLPVVVGTAWGAWMSGGFDSYVFLLALVATVLVHGASNVLNDVGDESNGTDRVNEDRIYPYTGGSRFIQTGILTQSAMAWLGAGLLLVAAILGALLLIEKGVVVLYFGLAGVALTVLYSLGPVQLNSIGVGEIAVGIGLGIIPVCGAAWLQGAVLDSNLLLFSIPVSVWVTAILLINEVPDIAADGASDKKTLPVRLGLTTTANVYFALHLTAAVATAYLSIRGSLPMLAPLVPLALLALAWRARGAIRTGIADRERMTQAIESTLAIHTIGCIWLSVCVVYQLAF